MFFNVSIWTLYKFIYLFTTNINKNDKHLFGIGTNTYKTNSNKFIIGFQN